MSLLAPDVSLLCFQQLYFLNMMKNDLAFIRDRCCHLTICVHMMEPHYCSKNCTIILKFLSAIHISVQSASIEKFMLTRLLNLLKSFFMMTIHHWSCYPCCYFVRVCSLVASATAAVASTRDNCTIRKK